MESKTTTGTLNVQKEVMIHLLFWLLLVYLDRLFPEVEEISSFEMGKQRL